MSNYPPKPGKPMDSFTPKCEPRQPIHDDCGCTPPPPPCQPPAPYPAWGCIPPVPTVLEGSSLYEAIAIQAQRTNQCIEQWNAISGECFETLRKVVNAARMNDVYYSDCEVKYTKGYSEEEGCAYSIIRKKAVDSKGKPIFVKLALPYNNTTNSGLKDEIFNVSYMESANVIITAVPVEQTSWNAPCMFAGAPIPGTEAENSFSYGFSKSGNLKYFTADADDIVLRQNGMENVIGGCTPLLSEGAIVDDAKLLVNKGAITAIGQNGSTGDVFFFQCSANDQPGMTGLSVAKLFQGYGCTTAVITSFIAASNQNESNGMLYMGQMCENPQGGIVPDNLAYWYISKKGCFKNEFETTIANLVQTTGQNAWRNYLFGVELNGVSDRVTQNAKDIAAEIQRAKDAEEVLQNNIDAETDRATEAEQELRDSITAETERAEAAETALDNKIQAETARATAAETALDNKIKAETARAESAESVLDSKIQAETARATAAETLLQSNIDKETTRATTRENEIQAALDAEIKSRIDADNDLINAINQEILARQAADTAIQANLERVQTELTGKIADNTAAIDAETKRAEQAEGDLQSNINAEVNRATAAETELQTNINQLENKLEQGDIELPYLPLTGGTVTGNIALKNAETNDVVTMSVTTEGAFRLAGPDDKQVRVAHLAEPVNDTDAATKAYVDEHSGGGTGGDYLPLAGGTLTGPMKVESQIGYPPDAQTTVDGEHLQARYLNLTDPEGNTLNGVQLFPHVSDSIDSPHLAIGTLKDGQTDPSTNVRLSSIADPTNTQDAATKHYVDTEIAKIPSGGGGVTPEYLEQYYVQKAGDTMSGDLTVKKGVGSMTIGVDSDAQPTIKSNGNMKVQVGAGAAGIAFSDGTGDGVNMYGVSTINHYPPDMTTTSDDIKINDDSVQVLGPLQVVNAAGEVIGTIEAGQLKLNNSTIMSTTTDGTENLTVTAPGNLVLQPSLNVDINNRTIQNVNGIKWTNGPTLRTFNASTVSFATDTLIKGVSSPVADNDAANKSYVNTINDTYPGGKFTGTTQLGPSSSIFFNAVEIYNASPTVILNLDILYVAKGLTMFKLSPTTDNASVTLRFNSHNKLSFVYSHNEVNTEPTLKYAGRSVSYTDVFSRTMQTSNFGIVKIFFQE